MGTMVTAAGQAWRAREAAVLDLAEAFALGRVRNERQCHLLAVALAGLREQTADMEQPPAPYIHLAPLVYAGLWGDDAPAYPLGAATALLFAGLAIFDDLAGGLPERWAGCRPPEAHWAAMTLLCALPHLAIASLEAPPVAVAAMQETLAGGLLSMATGQGKDLAPAGAGDVLPEKVTEPAAGRSGEELATFAALGAQLAGASPRVVDACAQLGRALGDGGQLVSDCHDLFHAGRSRGTRTLPIAQHLARLGGAERAAFLVLLDRARADAAAQEEVRAQLLAAGIIGHCAVAIEAHRRRAYQAVGEAGLLEPARGLLGDMIAAFTPAEAPYSPNGG